jgi:hyperosmotically inducible protein
MNAPPRPGIAALAAIAAIVISSGCAAMRSSPRAGGFVDDAAITSKIRSETVADNIDAAAISVETSSGTVTLSGFARSLLEKQTAGSVAMKIKAVSQVRYEIALRP